MRQLVSLVAKRTIELPFFIMSGSGDLTLLAMKATVADFVRKPFGPSELLSVPGQLPVEKHRV